MNKAKKSLVALGLSAGLVGGGAAGAILGTPGLSGAQDDTTTTVPAEQDADQGRPGPSERLAEVLAPLVTDGTITQAQADAVIDTLVAAAPERGHGGHRRGGPGIDAAAAALGITEDDLRSELRDGLTVAQVAEARGVPVQDVIDAMVADLQEHLAEEVAEGDLTQDEADEKLAAATERITDLVENGRPGRGGPPESRSGD